MLDITTEIEDTALSKQFNITLNSYEGPIDLLLELARKQKVDLSEISILELAEQYINFINEYKDIHLEIAADYLVMAAWLTYLKSRLLLPKEDKSEDHTPEELEEALKYQLQRLEAFQLVSRLENISPSLEPSHAFAEAICMAPKLKPSDIIIVNSCGDSFKDKDIIKQKLGSYTR